MREVKNLHDSVVHQVVLADDPHRLRDLLSKGVRATNRSIDGATPLHRAAEIGSIRCAEILLKFNVDVDAENFQGQTPYHVAGINKHLEFGRLLKTKGARPACRPQCTKCRYLTQMIIRLRKREQEASVSI